jgi:hypothetical protein
LPGLFADDNNYTSREVWLKREILLLNDLKRKLKSQGLTKPLTREETAFLDALKEDNANPMRGRHEEWLMDAVMTVTYMHNTKKGCRVSLWRC